MFFDDTSIFVHVKVLKSSRAAGGTPGCMARVDPQKWVGCEGDPCVFGVFVALLAAQHEPFCETNTIMCLVAKEGSGLVINWLCLPSHLPSHLPSVSM